MFINLNDKIWYTITYIIKMKIMIYNMVYFSNTYICVNNST